MTNKQTNKLQSKEFKKKKKPSLLDEAYWCCSKLFHLHKRARRNTLNKAKQQGATMGSKTTMGGGGKRYLKKASNKV
jgi:hypothetical protein